MARCCARTATGQAPTSPSAARIRALDGKCSSGTPVRASGSSRRARVNRRAGDRGPTEAPARRPRGGPSTSILRFESYQAAWSSSQGQRPRELVLRRLRRQHGPRISHQGRDGEVVSRVGGPQWARNDSEKAVQQLILSRPPSSKAGLRRLRRSDSPLVHGTKATTENYQAGIAGCAWCEAPPSRGGRSNIARRETLQP